jgi:hypothetical protein
MRQWLHPARGNAEGGRADISGEAHLYVVLMTSTPKGGSQDDSTDNKTSKQQSARERPRC